MKIQAKKPSNKINGPMSFFWLHKSNKLQQILKDIQDKFKRSVGLQPSTLCILSGVDQVDEELTNILCDRISQLQLQYSMHSIELSKFKPQFVDAYLKNLRDKLQIQHFFIIRPERQHAQIRSCLEHFRLYNFLEQYDNYYQLQNCLYVFCQTGYFEMPDLDESDGENTTTVKQQNLLESYAQKIDHKIEHMEVGGKLAEFDGVQLWHCTYKNIPHTFMKCVKEGGWLQGLNKMLLHSSHPKTIEGLPLLPPLTALRPRKEHLATLLSFLDVLRMKYPTHSPTVDSMFEYQGRLIVFTRQGWQMDRSWLCYRVVKGPITYQGFLNWCRCHPNDSLLKSIQQYS